MTSGDARFEVLSPTLIRTEYAGDGAFTDAATFNAIGRDGFAPVRYTSAVHDGWLSIDTGKAGRLAQLFIAARNRSGSRRERAERFGPDVASGYARVVLVRRLVLGVLIAVCLVAAVLGVAAIVAGGPARQALVTTAVAILFAVIAVTPLVGVAVRRSPAGLLHLADTLLPRLRVQDATLTRAQVAAMVRKPRLYDVWEALHSQDAESAL